MTDECVHVWVANAGDGGEPVFRPNRHMSADPLMHVCCEECNARTWFTREQWEWLPESDDTDADDAGNSE